MSKLLKLSWRKVKEVEIKSQSWHEEQESTFYAKYNVTATFEDGQVVTLDDVRIPYATIEDVVCAAKTLRKDVC